MLLQDAAISEADLELADFSSHMLTAASLWRSYLCGGERLRNEGSDRQAASVRPVSLFDTFRSEFDRNIVRHIRDGGREAEILRVRKPQSRASAFTTSAERPRKIMGHSDPHQFSDAVDCEIACNLSGTATIAIRFPLIPHLFSLACWQSAQANLGKDIADKKPLPRRREWFYLREFENGSQPPAATARSSGPATAIRPRHI